MFQYVKIPQSLQHRQQCFFFKDYVKVLYNEPHQLLKDYQFEPVWVTDRFKSYDLKIKEFAVRNDDIWVVSYPKTGTTLTCELVRVILSGFRFEEIEKRDIAEQVHFLEYNALTSYVPGDSLERAAKDNGQRIMKTHLNLNLLPNGLTTNKHKRPKIIYVTRNPKDAAISYFHHHKNLHGYEGSLQEFLQDFLLGDQAFGSYFRHVEEYLRFAKLREDILVIKYEDLLFTPEEVIQQAASFLDIPVTLEKVRRTVDFLKFDNMKLRKNSNLDEVTEQLKSNGNIEGEFRFLRNGKVNSFGTEMPDNYIKLFDDETSKWEYVCNIYGGV